MSERAPEEPTGEVIEVGALRITAHAIEMGSGEEREWRIARASIRTVQVVRDSPAERPLGQLVWGLVYLGGGGVLLWRNELLGVGALGIPLLLLGLFVLRYILWPVTLVRIEGVVGSKEISFGKRLPRADEDALRARIRSLGYPG